MTASAPDGDAIACAFLQQYFAAALAPQKDFDAAAFTGMYHGEATLAISNGDEAYPSEHVRGNTDASAKTKIFFGDATKVDVVAVDTASTANGLVISCHSKVVKASSRRNGFREQAFAVQQVFHLVPTARRQHCFSIAAEVLRYRPITREATVADSRVPQASPQVPAATPAAAVAPVTVVTVKEAAAAEAVAQPEKRSKPRKLREAAVHDSKDDAPQAAAAAAPPPPPVVAIQDVVLDLKLRSMPTTLTKEEAIATFAQFGAVADVVWEGTTGALVTFGNAGARQLAFDAVKSGNVRFGSRSCRLFL